MGWEEILAAAIEVIAAYQKEQEKQQAENNWNANVSKKLDAIKAQLVTIVETLATMFVFIPASQLRQHKFDLAEDVLAIRRDLDRELFDAQAKRISDIEAGVIAAAAKRLREQTSKLFSYEDYGFGLYDTTIAAALTSIHVAVRVKEARNGLKEFLTELADYLDKAIDPKLDEPKGLGSALLSIYQARDDAASSINQLANGRHWLIKVEVHVFKGHLGEPPDAVTQRKAIAINGSAEAGYSIVDIGEDDKAPTFPGLEPRVEGPAGTYAEGKNFAEQALARIDAEYRKQLTAASNMEKIISDVRKVIQFLRKSAA